MHNYRYLFNQSSSSPYLHLFEYSFQLEQNYTLQLIFRLVKEISIFFISAIFLVMREVVREIFYFMKQ